MIEVVVQEKTVEKTIEINLPSKNGLYEITVYVDGVLQYGPSLRVDHGRPLYDC